MAKENMNEETVELEKYVDEEGRIGDFDDQEDGEKAFFPGGPDLNMVEGWKSRFQGELYFSDFDGDIFIWRPIKRNEYKRVVRNKEADSFYKEEKVCETCVLWPLNYGTLAMTNGKAGIPTMLFDMIMERSGFSSRVEAIRI